MVLPGLVKCARSTPSVAMVSMLLAPPGTEIVVEGWQAKDESTRANGSNITYPDGRKLFIGSQGTGAPGDKGGDKGDK